MKPVVACNHRSVRCKYGCRPDFTGSLRQRRSFCKKLSEPLKHHEGCVVFVRMPDVWVNSQRAQGTHSTYTQDYQLSKSFLGISRIETSRESAIDGVVLLYVGVKEVQMDPSDTNQPHRKV